MQPVCQDLVSAVLELKTQTCSETDIFFVQQSLAVPCLTRPPAESQLSNQQISMVEVCLTSAERPPFPYREPDSSSATCWLMIGSSSSAVWRLRLLLCSVAARDRLLPQSYGCSALNILLAVEEGASHVGCPHGAAMLDVVQSHDSPFLQTIGELFQALYEMGFDESQVQAAVRAGCFRVQEAADWILQGGEHRGTLRTQPGDDQSSAAVSAFNPPQDGGGAAPCQPVLPASPTSPDCHPLTSTRRLQLRREYEERHHASLAQEVREGRRTKKVERDQVLRRIAEDRQMRHNKDQNVSPSAANEGQSSHSHVTPHNRCALLIRLPSGQSLRLGFPAESSLRCVCDHLNALHPSLSPCSLLQTFPTRHFTEEDLSHSLQELGLTPNATLCVRPKQEPRPAAPPQEPLDMDSQLQDLMRYREEDLVPILSSPAQSVSHNVQMREELTAHSWGRGHRLTPQDEDDTEEVQRFASDESRHVLPSPRDLHSPPHQWPSNGLRLRSADGNDASPPGAAPSGPLHVLARAAAEMRQESAERRAPPPMSRVSSVPPLRSLTLHRAMAVITAPSMQYPGSLSGLTPDLGELIIDHMVKERILRPKTLELFIGCPIRSLTLTCYQYCTNDLIRQLRGFPSLRVLSLSSSNLITDQALSVLQHLHRLHHLNLSACRNLTEACLLHLRGLKHLSHLILDQTKVSDGGMCDFLMSSSCPLTHLSLNQTAITEVTLGLLVDRMPGLRVLSVKHTQVSEVSSLNGLSQLGTLHLDNTGVTEESLQVVRSLPALSTLTLSGAPSLLSNRVLELVSGLSLTRLVLPGRHSLSDEGLVCLSHLGGLTELDLTDHTQITDRGVQHVSKLSRIRVLSLCNTSVSDAGLVHLRGLNLLEELSLDRTKVTSKGVSLCVPHLLHLQVLGLSDTLVGDNVLKLGIQNCKNLLKVNLSRTRVTDKGLRFLRRSSIMQINLDGTGITLEGMSDLVLTCDTLTSVRFANLRHIPGEEMSDEETA